MHPFFSYYGSKWRCTPSLYDPPLHDTIIEPFAGSAGYSTRYASRDVILCDKDEHICGIWDYLINVSPNEIMALPDLPGSLVVDDLNVPQEVKWLIGFWVIQGSTHAAKKASTWFKQGNHKSRMWGPAVRERLASQVDCIKHWRIIHGSYESIDHNGEATWFVDPPYEDKGFKYRHNSRKIDYEHLAKWCQDREGQVIVCENEGATWLPFSNPTPINNMKGTSSVEVTWTKGCLEQGLLF